jgi:hypothetical protein
MLLKLFGYEKNEICFDGGGAGAHLTRREVYEVCYSEILFIPLYRSIFIDLEYL